MWMEAHDAIDRIDKTVAVYCVTLGDPPSEHARPGQWVGWYRWCAERVDLFDAYDLERVRTREVLEAVERLEKVVTRRGPLPEVVVPSLLEWYPRDGAMLATGYSAYDMDALPADLFVLLARLDGKRPWREALGSEPGLDEALVQRMWARGMLAEPDEAFREGSTAVAFRDGPWSGVPEFQEQILTSLTASFSPKD